MLQGRRPRRLGRRDRRPDRAVGIGQVLAAARRRPAGASHRRPDHRRWPRLLRPRRRARAPASGSTPIGFVYQFHHLLPEFTALDNVALPLMIAGGSRARGPGQGAGAADRAGPGRAPRTTSRPSSPAASSSGSRSPGRWPIVRACCWPTSPPATSIRPPRRRCSPACTTWSAPRGVAALIATHNLDLTRHMDRVLALKDGRLVSA